MKYYIQKYYELLLRCMYISLFYLLVIRRICIIVFEKCYRKLRKCKVWMKKLVDKWWIKPNDIKCRYLDNDWERDEIDLMPHAVFEILSKFIERNNLHKNGSDDLFEIQLIDLYNWWHNEWQNYRKELYNAIITVDINIPWYLLKDQYNEQQLKASQQLKKFMEEEDKMCQKLIENMKKVCELSS